MKEKREGQPEWLYFPFGLLWDDIGLWKAFFLKQLNQLLIAFLPPGRQLMQSFSDSGKLG